MRVSGLAIAQTRARGEDPQGWLDRVYDREAVVIQVDDGSPDGERGRHIRPAPGAAGRSLSRHLEWRFGSEGCGDGGGEVGEAAVRGESGVHVVHDVADGGAAGRVGGPE
jgi:hypothetical protein